MAQSFNLGANFIVAHCLDFFMYKIRFVAGFTLLELLITISIAAILLSVAVPGFSNFIRSSRAEVQPAALVNSLAFAKSEAVKRGQPIYVKATNDSHWHLGWGIWVDTDGNGSIEDEDELLKQEPAFSGEATLVADGIDEIIFGRQGNLIGVLGAVGSVVEFQYRFNDAAHCRLERNIAINHLGRVTLARSGCESNEDNP